MAYAVAVGTRATVAPRMRSAYGRRRSLARLGQSSSGVDTIAAAASMGANALVPGAGVAVGPVIEGLAQVFGGNPATGKDAEREAHMYTLYEEAMTSPGSSASISAVVELYTIANNLFDPINNVQQNNPQATRTFAQEVLQTLATQGWTNIGLNPIYTGVGASGEVFAADASTGQQRLVASRGGVSSGGSVIASLFSDPLFLLFGAVALGAGVYAVART